MNTRLIGSLRLIVGLIQGIAVYLLDTATQHSTWPATDPVLFVPLLLMTIILPAVVIVSLGHIRIKPLLLWMLALTVVVGEIGSHDVLRRGAVVAPDAITKTRLAEITPSFELIFFLGAAVFIAQSLIMSATADGRRIASYPRYFDISWKLVIQFGFSTAFTLVFWLVLAMGTALFELIKLHFMIDLIKHNWFDIPATTIAFSYALHLTDVRANLVRGIRTLQLTLLSWLLPIMASFVAIFMIGIPFEGMHILWATHHTSQILLGTAVWLILLINTAYHDGTTETRPGNILRYSGTLGAVLLLPLTAIALYALIPRVAEYGWTVNLIDVLFCLIVVLCYAVGYFVAAISRGDWLQGIEKTNIYTAFVLLIVLFGLFSPVADPARLSVADQMARLNSDKVSAEKFDYSYLKQKGLRYGIDALNQLKTHAVGAQAGLIKEKVDAVLSGGAGQQQPQDIPHKSATDIAGDITVYPQGHVLPDSFVKKNWQAYMQTHTGFLPACLTTKQTKCDAFMVDPTPTAPQQIILVNRNYINAVLITANKNDWIPAGIFAADIRCKGVLDALHTGQYRMTTSPDWDLQVQGMHIRVNQQTRLCKDGR
ncbi:MAG: DUF4153 domain-containing protein [Burkholderiales bacterium]